MGASRSPCGCQPSGPGRGGGTAVVDDNVRHGHVELSAQTLQLVVFLPRLAVARVCDDDDLVGTEVAQLVLERGRRIGVADRAASGDVVRVSPRQRPVESRPCGGEFVVDVGSSDVSTGASTSSSTCSAFGWMIRSRSSSPASVS